MRMGMSSLVSKCPFSAWSEFRAFSCGLSTAPEGFRPEIRYREWSRQCCFFRYPNLPIQVHTHDTAGTGVASMIAAVEVP